MMTNGWKLSPGEITPAAVAEWLSENGYAADVPGHGHVTCEELAEALHKEYLIYRAYRTDYTTVAGPTRSPRE